ncbi:MAG: OmpA family protein [Luteolibacter sp.]|uniref:OmpA family protein n=1 Tax=Luteolibacter sp. TaxID=1962973 RepID=UPI003264B5E9
MIPKHTLLIAVLVMPLSAQPAPPPVVTETTVTETLTPGKKVVEETVVEHRIAPPVAFDPRGRLEIAPHLIPVPEAAAGKTTETTETTTTHVAGRTYNTERSVVVVEGRELPYVTVPVLFVKETADLLDSESRSALDQTAAAILEISKSNPTAKFDIEGHTSTDGADEMNLNLSAERARRVFAELTGHYQIPAAILSAHGYGESYPTYPNGTEEQMTLDRRVLVVRVN